MNKDVQIRDLQLTEELEQIRKLEALIWSFEESIPVNQTIAAVKNGGFVLGAYLGEDLIGFQYSFPGFDGKKPYLCSHSLGIHPNYRKLGIGEKLKRAQRETAILKGYELITWTYDPLETINGNLNLHKLGGICTAYLKNVYGEMADGLNNGIPTDRFLVEWRIRDSFVNSDMENVQIPRVILTCSHDGFLAPEHTDLSQLQDLLAVPVPSNFQEIKKGDFSLALKWRETTRKTFSHYLKQGWIVFDLIKDGKNAYLYLLKKMEKGINNGN